MTYPLSQTQEGIYVTCVNHQEEGNYNINMLYKLNEEVDTDCLRQALDKVIEAHPYVKSRLLTDENGEVVFEDHRADEFQTSVFEVNDIEEVRAHLGADYDLSKDLLFRLEIYKTQKGNYLYVDFHHILFDGFSFKVFIDDLAKAYNGETLVAEKTSGFDIAQKEIEERKSAKYGEAKAWYAQEFGAACEIDSMPLADIYGDDETRYVRKWVKLNVDETAKSEVCQKAGVEESVLFTTAFGMTLSKYIGESEVLYNTIYHGRQDEETHRSFTMMVKTLPVYHNLEQTPTVVELLQQTKAQNYAARQYSCYSYRDLATDLGVKSDISFAYQGDFHSWDITLNGKQQASEDLRTNTPGIKFLCMVMIENGEYYVKLEYQKNKYSDTFIDGFIATYEHILSELCAKEMLAEVTICNEEMLSKLDSFNEKENPALSEVDANETVLSLFQKAAKQYSDQVAAVFKEKQYTYKQLDELTDKIGALIYNKVKDCGKEEPVVSILIPRNEYMFILPLSVMKAGCAYQPLDPSYPQERLNFMVKDADATLLLADPELRPIINEYEGEILLTSELTEDALGSTSLIPHVSFLTPHSLFILLYTSGSTGVPKGVMLEHQNLIAFIKWYRRYYDLKPEHNVAAYASFGFDANMMDQYPALTTGATLHVIPEEIRLDLVALNEYFEKNNVTHSFITTQVGVQFLQNAENHSLKHLSVGGEKLISIDPSKNYTVHNAYGPTECTIFTTTLQVQKKEPNIPIGKPTDELECYVMDKNLHRVPVGAAGELVIVGKQVGRGYLNRPDKTAEAFFSYNGKRAYHSGDIVRYREDGNIEFVGRKDGQVKIRGFRIELKEVEAVIRDFSGIKNVTVQAFDNPGGGKFIAAYIVSDEQVDIEALNNFILDQKPPYMVPAVTMQIPEIPLNVNQKVDKKALPKPERQLAENRDQITTAAPLNALETELKTIIASVVNTVEFGVTDVLGYLGLTSISSIKLATLIYKRFGIQVDSRSLAKTGSLLSIENEILTKWLNNENEDSGSSSQTSASLGKERMEEVLSAPLSYSQLGVYTECISHPDDTHYNIPFCVTMPQGITSLQVKNALEKMFAAHPYLNTHFQDTDNGDTIQCPMQQDELVIPILEMSEDELEQEKKTFVRPFHLQKGPLYRLEIIEGPSGICLLVDFHHLIMDGGSVDIFFNQLCQALDDQPLEAENYDYYQFVADQKIDPETEKFFATQLGQIEESSALLPDVYTVDGEHTEGFVSYPTDLKAVEAKCLSLNITPASLYLAAFMIAVSKYTAEETVGICTISNGRSNLRLSDTFGMFVNTLPLVGKVDQEMTVEDFLLQVSQTFTDTLFHEEYPFAKVAENYSYAANIMYAYQVGVLNNYTCNNGELKLQDLDVQRAMFPVAFFVNGSMEEGVQLEVKYDESLFTQGMMQGLAVAVQNITNGLLTKTYVKEIELCDDQMLSKLDSFNEKEKPALSEEDVNETVLSLFQKAAKQNPDQVAAVFKEKQYTYKQLDELTDKIGALIYNKIKDCGNEEPVVSILIPRNEYMFILPLSVMKAGCAYQPLDPSYPQERLNFMVKDADAVLLIADNGLKDVVNEYEGETLLTSELTEDKLTTSKLQNHKTLQPQSLFILLYTSGSTGVPKGVMLEHRQVLGYVRWYQQNYEMTPESVTAAYASFGFDANMMDMYPTLTCGATLCIIPEEIRLDLEALCDFMNEKKVTIAFMTTQVAQQFALNIDGCKTLKHLSMGGEKMMSMNPRKDFKLHNLYGPTECSVAVTHYEVCKQEQNIPIGKPTATSTLWVVDKSLHRLPVGAAGEMIVSGQQVGRGYLNRPKKTAEVFIEHEGKRWYRTGDIVRYREDGNIEFVGRKDGQVKIRGFRIELKEVEAVIRDFPGIKNVTVQAFDNPSGGKFIAAYVVSDEQVDVTALNKFILDQKPPYMVPAVTMQIPEIPLNVNQKVDKKALPKPVVQKAEYVVPTTEVEKDFCQFFESVLGLERVSVTDDFFEIGGSSIIALKLVVAANKAGYDIVYNNVFDYTTPRMLAEFVASMQQVGETVNDVDEAASANTTTDDDTRSYIGEDGYDYRPLNALLQQNTMETFKTGARQEIGDVFLTGATGFLGIHVLYELISNYNGKIYCFVRSKDGMSGEQRLKIQLFYYFESDYEELFGTRLFVIEGDATNPEDLNKVNYPAQSVINCAACVKHFAKGNEIERMNIDSVRNLITWCLAHDARLVHVSTGSVAGFSVAGFPTEDHILNEQTFYYGQDLSNQYVHSKFMAERYILEAILKDGLNAQIMRVGNLSSRDRDGEFQINFFSNNFMSTLAAFHFMGVIPFEMMNEQVEFSPIDATAHTILLLAQAPKENIVFHPFNIHTNLMVDVLHELEKYGKPFRMVEGSEFSSIFSELLNNPDNIDKLRPLMAYKVDVKTAMVMLKYDSSFTSQILYRMGYCWPITTWDYVQRFISAIAALGFFEGEH